MFNPPTAAGQRLQPPSGLGLAARPVQESQARLTPEQRALFEEHQRQLEQRRARDRGRGGIER